MGSLVDGMRDATGQMYMRNRYYDPATGQFTQTDPIGLAGGLNTYGFANGDPVSYSDPYGLSAGCDPPTPACMMGLGSLQREWNNFKTGAVQTLENVQQSAANALDAAANRARLYVRTNTAHLNSQFEVDGQGRTAIRTSEGASSSITSAQLGVSVDLASAPSDAVLTVRVSKRVAELGIVRVAVTTTTAVSSTGTPTPLTTGVEVGRSISVPGKHRGWSGSATTKTGCIGSGCQAH